MQKFFSEKHLKYFDNLPFSYFSTNLYLDCLGYIFERNKEYLLVTQDIFFPHDFPSLFLPKKEENWKGLSITFATLNDIDKLNDKKIEILQKEKVGSEYFYKTNNLLNLKGKFGQRVRQFKKNYPFKIYNNYSKEKIVQFYNFWKKQKARNSSSFDESEKFFFFCINNLSKYEIKQIYVETDNKLIGLALGIQYQKGWIGLHLKVDYNYKGLSRFLHHERAKLFKNFEYFSIGTGSREEGITKFKEELCPHMCKNYFYLLTNYK